MAGPNSYINIGPIGSGALFAASHAPGIAGGLATLAQLGMRGYNVYNGNQIRQGLGLPGQSVGQWLGGILGLNDRGSLAGNNTVAAPGEFHNPYNGSSAAITTGGLYDDGGFFGRMLAGLVGDYANLRTSYTPEEARLRQIAAANYGTQGQQGSPAAPATAAAPVPMAYRLDGTPLGPADSPVAQAAIAAGNATIAGGPAGYGNGQAGSLSGGQYGNAQTGGMAGPVNQNQATGMLSRI